MVAEESGIDLILWAPSTEFPGSATTQGLLQPIELLDPTVVSGDLTAL